ncbi:MAG: dienelactone hydrolase family protein [Acidimicrobiia bacterium]
MPQDTSIELADGIVLESFLEGKPTVGTVIFAHGSGSGRHSPRNRHVAEVLQRKGMQTLLLDLLTAEEERVDMVTREHRFDIDRLSNRVVGAIDWLPDESPIGVFGASTGAAAALRAAAERPGRVFAVVSRGGRPDLAGDALPRVAAPTLLIVGGRDLTVLDINRQAQALMKAEVDLEVVPGATHLFEEPGTLDTVAELAADWFHTHLGEAGQDR